MDTLSAISFILVEYTVMVKPSFFVDWSYIFNCMSFACEWLLNNLLTQFYNSRQVSVLVNGIWTFIQINDLFHPRKFLAMIFELPPISLNISVIVFGGILIELVINPYMLLLIIAGGIWNFWSKKFSSISVKGKRKLGRLIVPSWGISKEIEGIIAMMFVYGSNTMKTSNI